MGVPAAGAVSAADEAERAGSEAAWVDDTALRGSAVWRATSRAPARRDMAVRMNVGGCKGRGVSKMRGIKRVLDKIKLGKNSNF